MNVDSKAEQDYVKSFHHLPSWVVEDVEINEQLKRFSVDPRLVTWLNKDFLLKHAAIFGIGTNVDIHKGGIRLPHTQSMHRATLLKLLQVSSPFVDEYGNYYGRIDAKGCGMVEDDEAEYYSLVNIYFDPAGLFGDYHSRQEMEVSNGFAQFGGRTSRVLGILTLNPKKLLEWFSEIPKDQKDYYHLDRMLEKVIKNNDNPAICVRLLGADRYKDYNECEENSVGLCTQQHMVQRAATLLLWEIEGRGTKSFLDRYNLDGVYPFQTHMLELSAGRFSVDNLSSLVYLQCYFYFYNWGVKDKLSKARYEGELSAAFTEQDADLAGFMYDWETSKLGPGYKSDDVGRGFNGQMEWFFKGVHLYGDKTQYLKVGNTAELINKARYAYNQNFSEVLVG